MISVIKQLFYVSKIMLPTKINLFNIRDDSWHENKQRYKKKTHFKMGSKFAQSLLSIVALNRPSKNIQDK